MHLFEEWFFCTVFVLVVYLRPNKNCPMQAAATVFFVKLLDSVCFLAQCRKMRLNQVGLVLGYDVWVYCVHLGCCGFAL